MNQTSRAGEIGIEEQPRGAIAGELDGPALRAPNPAQDQLGRRGAVGRAARIEPHVSPDPVPEIAPGRAGRQERLPIPAEHLEPVRHRLGEDGEDEQRANEHGTPGRDAGKLGSGLAQVRPALAPGSVPCSAGHPPHVQPGRKG